MAGNTSKIDSKTRTIIAVDGADAVQARWKCSLKHIDHFDLDWEYYDTRTNKWNQGNNGTKSVPTSSKAGGYFQDTFSLSSLPTTVNQVRVKAKAIAKTHKVTETYISKGKTKTRKKDVPYFTVPWSKYWYYDYSKKMRPSNPAAPTATMLDSGQTRISWDGFTRPTTCIVIDRFSKADGYAPASGRRVAPNASNGLHQPKEVFQNASGASWIDVSTASTPGQRFRYMCRAHNYDATKGSVREYSMSAPEIVAANKTNWWLLNSLSEEVQTRPLDPRNQGASYYGMNGDKARIKVSWLDNGFAGDSYEVRYAESLDLLKTTGGYDTYSPSDLTFTGNGSAKQCVVEVEPGKTWFFRVVVKNSNKGDMGISAFGGYASCLAGEPPSAPTLADLDPYYAIGDEVQAWWTHNAPDKSAQTAAQVEVTVDGTAAVHNVAGATSSHIVDTSEIDANSVVRVRVRTKGAHPNWSPWSATAQFTVLAPPTCYIQATQPNPDYDPEDASSSQTVRVDDAGTLSMLPFTATLSAGGTEKQTPIAWFFELLAASDFVYTDARGEDAVMLSGQQMFSVTVDASDPGFDAVEQAVEVTAADGAFVTGADYLLRAYVTTDAGLRSEYATLAFGCEWEYEMPEPSVAGVFDDETRTVQLVASCYREVWPEDYDEDADDGTTEPEYELLPNVTLDVYRINYDASLTLLAEGLANSEDTAFTDYYPQFGWVSYRVVAHDPSIDAVSVFDSDEIPTPVYGIFIQWDQERYAGLDDEELPVYEGESVFLPWNIGVDESAEPDRELVGYIGRENPVAYFGTQLNVGGSWTAEIEKWEDAETLLQLRKLQRWQGTCHVRETSGVSYEAVVRVSFGRAYDSAVVPVTLEVTKVEGE